MRFVCASTRLPSCALWILYQKGLCEWWLSIHILPLFSHYESWFWTTTKSFCLLGSRTKPKHISNLQVLVTYVYSVFSDHCEWSWFKSPYKFRPHALSCAWLVISPALWAVRFLDRQLLSRADGSHLSASFPMVLCAVQVALWPPRQDWAIKIYNRFYMKIYKGKHI